VNIYAELINDIKRSGIIRRENLSLKEIAVGVFYSGVKLSDGSVGVCCTCAGDLLIEGHRKAITDEIPDLIRIHKRPIEDLMEYAGDPILLKSVIGVALLNALSDALFREKRNKYRIINGDCLPLLNIRDDDAVTMIGALPSYIKKLKDRVKRLTVIDNNPHLDECEGCPVIRGKDTYQAISDSSVLILTAVTYVNGTFDELMDLASPGCRTAIVGPSVGPYPEPFFRRGINVVGSIDITHPEELFAIVGRGGSIADFRKYAGKLTLTRELLPLR